MSTSAFSTISSSISLHLFHNVSFTTRPPVSTSLSWFMPTPCISKLLRQIVASPRSCHPKAGLDLYYRSNHHRTYPQYAYCTPLDPLVKFLDGKHGKGRSRTMACSYLISECRWTVSKALVRFTERRMRPGFGQGISIASQLRWVRYVNK